MRLNNPVTSKPPEAPRPVWLEIDQLKERLHTMAQRIDALRERLDPVLGPLMPRDPEDKQPMEPTGLCAELVKLGQAIDVYNESLKAIHDRLLL